MEESEREDLKKKLTEEIKLIEDLECSYPSFTKMIYYRDNTSFREHEEKIRNAKWRRQRLLERIAEL